MIGVRLSPIKYLTDKSNIKCLYSITKKNQGNMLNEDSMMLRFIQIMLIYLESEMQDSAHR